MQNFILMIRSIQDNVGFFTGDNCTVNKKIARDNSKPFVGCASHRFNLGVEKFLRSDSVARYYNKVASLMHELRTYKNTARLRTKTTLGPKRKNETRWTGAFEQFKRYEAWCSDPSFKLEDLFFVSMCSYRTITSTTPPTHTIYFNI